MGINMKLLKSISKFMFFFGAVCLILGAVSSKLSEENKGAIVQSGRMVNGKLVVDEDAIGRIGGNPDEERELKEYSILMYTAGVTLCVAGIVFLIVVKRMNRLPIQKRTGRVLAQKLDVVTIEFDDGTRNRMPMEPEVILMPGDTGTFDIKGGRVVGFNR